MREVGSAVVQRAVGAAGLGGALVPGAMTRVRPPGVVFRPLTEPAGRARWPIPLVETVAAIGVAPAWNAERETEAPRLAREMVVRVFGVDSDARTS